MKQLGIDLGSSFVKYAVFDMDRGILVCQSKRPAIAKRSNPDGKFEVPAKAIVKQVEDIIAEVTKQYEDVEGIIFSTQMHGFVFQTDDDNDPVYVSWQDQRSLKNVPGTDEIWLNSLKRKFPESIMKQTGVHIKTALALCNLNILIQEEYQNCPKGEFHTLGSYIIKHLTGNNCCHITNAAPSGMLNISKNEWADEVITEAGFTNIRFPKLLTGFETCGEYICRGKKLKVFPDYGDQQATILGCGPKINDLVINIGTAAQICQIVDSIVSNGYEVRPFFENTYLNTITNLPGGRNFEIYLDFIEDVGNTFFKQEISRSDLWQVLDSNEGWQSGGLVMNNNFYDVRDGSSLCGSIVNITPENFRSTALSAAACEGIAREYYRCYQILTKETIKPSRVLLAGGKLSRQKMMVAAISGFFDIPVVSAIKDNSVFDGLYRILQMCCGQKKHLNETHNLLSE